MKKLVKNSKFLPQLNNIEKITAATNHFFNFPYTKNIPNTNKNTTIAPI